jgi:hypothetical protein
MVQQDNEMCEKMVTLNNNTSHGEDASMEGPNPQGRVNCHVCRKLALCGNDQTIDS